MSSWAGKARPPRWDFSGMEHSCWICQRTFIGSNKFFLLEKGVFVKGNICPLLKIFLRWHLRKRKIWKNYGITSFLG